MYDFKSSKMPKTKDEWFLAECRYNIFALSADFDEEFYSNKIGDSTEIDIDLYIEMIFKELNEN